MIGRFLRAQVVGLAGDVVLLGVAGAGLAMSLSVAASIPADLARAAADVSAALGPPLDAVLALFTTVFAAVYGSFRYTIDRRDGVVAQRLMFQSRGSILRARMLSSVVGGAAVAVAVLLGGHVALTVAMGGTPVDPAVLARTVGLGAVAALWGLGVGLVVQAHLPALFVAPMSMAAATLVAMLWSAGAAFLPVVAMLEAFRFDVTAVGLRPEDRLRAPLAVLLTGGWSALALIGGTGAFLRRDVK